MKTIKRRYRGEHMKRGLIKGAIYSVTLRVVPFFERLFRWKFDYVVEVYNQHLSITGFIYYKSMREFRKDWKMDRKMKK